MFIAAAVCPAAPGIVRPLTGSADGGFDQPRQRAVDAVRSLIALHPDRVVVMAAGAVPEGSGDSAAGAAEPSSGGSLAGFGINISAGQGEPVLPPAHTVGAWLLDAVGWTGPRRHVASVTHSEHPREVLLVMADGSARRSLAAPGYLDARAEPFDESIAESLRTGDADSLAGIDLALAHELLADGVTALRWLGEMTKGAQIEAQLHFNAAPLGVGYFVAGWRLN